MKYHFKIIDFSMVKSKKNKRANVQEVQGGGVL